MNSLEEQYPLQSHWMHSHMRCRNYYVADSLSFRLVRRERVLRARTSHLEVKAGLLDDSHAMKRARWMLVSLMRPT